MNSVGRRSGGNGVSEPPNDDDKLVRMLSYQEQREAIEEKLESIDQQMAILHSIYKRNVKLLLRQREQATRELRKLICDEMKGRPE